MRRRCAIRCCRASRSTIPCRSRRTGRRKNQRGTLPESEAVAETDRRLGAVRDRVRAQPAKSKIRRPVEQASVLQSQGEIVLQRIVDSPSIDKCSLALGLSSADVVELISAGNEDYDTSAHQKIRSELLGMGNIDHHGERDLVNLGLDAKVC